MPNELNITFNYSKKGYEPEEVDKVIDDMFRDIKNFEKQVNAQAETIKKQAEALQSVDQIREKESAHLAKLISTAVTLAEQTEKDATDKSTQMLQEATTRAEQAVQEAQAKARQIESESQIAAEQRVKEVAEQAATLVKDAKTEAEKITSQAVTDSENMRKEAELLLAQINKNYSQTHTIISNIKTKINTIRSQQQEINTQFGVYLNELESSVTGVSDEISNSDNEN